MTEKTVVGQAYLKDVRLSFPHLAEPHASVADGAKKYRASFLMDPETPAGKKAIAAAKKAAQEVIDQAWPKTKKCPAQPHRKCLKHGNDCTNQAGEVYKGYEDQIVVVSANESQPTLLYRNKKRVPDSEIKKVFFGGCRVEAIVRFYAITDPKKGGAGLFASLEGVRFWEEDEAFGSQGVSEDAFDDYDDEDERFGDEDEGGNDDLV